MKFQSKILICVLTNLLIFSPLFPQEKSMRIMTYNIRYANENPGEEWSTRKYLISEMIKFHKPDIFGVQEALKIQIDFLTENFMDFYWVGVGRENGDKEGEYSAIFVNKKFTLIDNGTYWLSQTPDYPSIGWDAAFKRLVTWVKVSNPSTLDTLIVLNTHFDHISKTARKNSSSLILEKTKPFISNFPVILMGDFNDTDPSDFYKTLTKNNIFHNAQYQPNVTDYGTSITFNGFGTDFGEGKIDFIFVNNKIKVLRHGIIGDKIKGQYASDHMPVIIDFVIIK